MDEIWGSDNYSNEVTPNNEEGTYVKVNGSYISIEPGSLFRDVVKDVSLNAGFGKFRVYLNSQEIKPSEAPEIVNTGDRIEIRAYDEAGF